MIGHTQHNKKTIINSRNLFLLFSVVAIAIVFMSVRWVKNENLEQKMAIDGQLKSTNRIALLEELAKTSYPMAGDEELKKRAVLLNTLSNKPLTPLEEYEKSMLLKSLE